MSIADILLLDFDHEIAGTRRLLERIPEKDPQWKPHEKSMPIGRLALHTARLPEFGKHILTTDGLDFAKEKWPDIVFQSTGHLLSELDRTSAELKHALERSSDEDLNRHWKLSMGDKVFADAPRKVLYRTVFLNHMLHHRAQLGVYLRLLNIPVPSLYGPSADEPLV